MGGEGDIIGGAMNAVGEDSPEPPPMRSGT